MTHSDAAADTGTENRGIECPNCGCHHFRTIQTRAHAAGIYRRRECRYCGRRLSTIEHVNAAEIEPDDELYDHTDNPF